MYIYDYYSLERRLANYLKFYYKNKIYLIDIKTQSHGKKNFFTLELSQKESIDREFHHSLEKFMYANKINEIYFRLIYDNTIVDYDLLIKQLNLYFFEVNEINLILINLKKPIFKLWQDVRKSYKSLINRETKFLEIKFSDNKNEFEIVFNDWIDLYSKALRRGNVILNNKSINLLRKSIEKKECIISFAYEFKVPVGGAMFSIKDKYSIYQSAANTNMIEADKKRAVGHFIVWNTIDKLKSLDINSLEMGTFYDVETHSNYLINWAIKENKINKFKTGFGGSIIKSIYMIKKLKI